MVATLVVVVVLPVLFVYALGSVPSVVATVLGDSAGPIVPRLDPLFVVGAVTVGLVVQFVVGPRLALRMEGAESAPESEYPRVHAAARRSAQRYDLPEPSVAVVDSTAPNAFVVGRSAGGATLAVTEGLLDAVDDEELDAVVAHELAHVKNRDTPLMSVAYLLPTVSYYVAVVATYVLYIAGRLLPFGAGHHGHHHGGGGGSDEDSGKAVLAVIVGILLTILIAALFWAASFLVFRVLSRQREYAADAAAAEATGDPAAMASALRTVDDGLSGAPDRDLREIDGGAEALFVVPVERANLDDRRETLLNADLFPETHPPTEERIDRLQALARGEVGRTAE
jgi:heat shock protein HtpX